MIGSQTSISQLYALAPRRVWLGTRHRFMRADPHCGVVFAPAGQGRPFWSASNLHPGVDVDANGECQDERLVCEVTASRRDSRPGMAVYSAKPDQAPPNTATCKPYSVAIPRSAATHSPYRLRAGTNSDHHERI